MCEAPSHSDTAASCIYDPQGEYDLQNIGVFQMYCIRNKRFIQFVPHSLQKCFSILSCSSRTMYINWVCEFSHSTATSLSLFSLFLSFLPHRAVGVLFSPMVSGWAGGWASRQVGGKCLSGLYLRNRKV